MRLSALQTRDRVSLPGPKGGLQRAVIIGVAGSASRQQVKVKCANGDEGILRQLVGTEVAVNVGGYAFVTKPEEVCGGLVQFRDVASKAVHDAVGEPDTDSSMSVVDDGEYAFENWEEEYTKAHRLMYGNDESKWTGWNNEAVWALAERAVGTGYTASGAASYPVYDELERGEDSMEWAPGTVAVAEACVVDGNTEGGADAPDLEATPDEESLEETQPVLEESDSDEESLEETQPVLEQSESDEESLDESFEKVRSWFKEDFSQGEGTFGSDVLTNGEGAGSFYELDDEGNVTFIFTKEDFEQEFVTWFPDHTDYELHIAKEMWNTFEATWREKAGQIMEYI